MNFNEDIRINDYLTCTDWGLWLKHKDVGLPSPQYKQVKVPARNGLIDYTEVLGGVRYDSREVTMEFMLRLDDGHTTSDDDILDFERIEQIKSKILNAIQGKEVKIIFPDDNGYYYHGRIMMTNWEVTKGINPVVNCTLSATCDPYKYSNSSSGEPWEWDTFDFETGVINEFYDIEVENHDSQTMTLIAQNDNTTPVVTVSQSGCWIELTKGNEVVFPKYYLSQGSQIIYDLELEEGEYQVEMGYDTDSGAATSTFTIETTGGSL